MYDAIVIGARVAGSPTGMLLARKGYQVLVVDRAEFPSDTISTHQVQIPGIARLKRWGLLDKVIATHAPATSHVRFDAGFAAFEGDYPEFEGIKAIYSPRRTYLDKILVDAAREAGAEVREDYVVDEVLFAGSQVSGIKGHSKNGAASIENATITIGADGKTFPACPGCKSPYLRRETRSDLRLLRVLQRHTPGSWRDPQPGSMLDWSLADQ